MKIRIPVCLGLVMFVMQAAVWAAADSNEMSSLLSNLANAPQQKISNQTVLQSEACKVALAPHEGTDRLDVEIRETQQNVRSAKDPTPLLERLGWQYVAKARVSFDPGYMSLAEQCALAMELSQPDAPAALILHGHILHSMHRFHEAEVLARSAVAARGSAFDYGLLGDALMEQGNLQEAGTAYQAMLDRKPCLQSYSRAAHLALLEGDLEQARALMKLAARAISLRDPEPAAWVYSRLGAYELQAGEMQSAAQCCQVALKLQPDYAPALLVQTRILLAQDKPAEALKCIEIGERQNPLPEYQWMLADVLRLNHANAEADAVEARLRKRGVVSDNRTTALFLATRNTEVVDSLRLASAELNSRTDVFTHDAVAWANLACGNIDKARDQSARALAEGTQDARLFLHAGLISAAAGEDGDARAWIDRAYGIRQMLFPSELKRLLQERERLKSNLP